MKLNNLYCVISLILLMSFAACSEDEELIDLVKPTATINQPAKGTLYYRGSSIVFEANFVDDVALAYCEVSLVTLKGWDVPWEPMVDKVVLSGTHDEVSAYQIFKETIPMDIMSGKYAINIKVVDVAGNYNMYSADIEIE